MTERPRLTIQIEGSEGAQEVIISLNSAAREKLIAELLKLDRTNDHFHVLNFEDWDDLMLSDIPYEREDKLACALKVSLRYDDWDAEYFPHVMRASEGS